MDKVRRVSNTAPRADRVAALLIFAGALLTVSLHRPGHISVDTLLQLRDGLSRDYRSSQPPAMSWLVAVMQGSPLGLGGLLVLNIGVWSACAWRLCRLLAERGGWRPWAALLVWFLFPVSFFYNGILWKDVLAAHPAALAFLLVIRGRRPSPLGGALIALIGLDYRRPRYWEVLAGLQVAGLAYLGSYLLIGIACDFRYAYFLVPVALIGTFSLWLPRRAHHPPGVAPA